MNKCTQLIVRCFAIILFVVLSGCSSGVEKQAVAGDVVGTWILDTKNLRSDGYTVEDFKDFALNIRSDGSFSIAGVPPGIFLNKGAENAAFNGQWKIDDRHGFNYVDFTINNLPNFTSGRYGVNLDEWIDGCRVIRLSGGGFIYIVRRGN